MGFRTMFLVNILSPGITEFQFFPGFKLTVISDIVLPCLYMSGFVYQDIRLIFKGFNKQLGEVGHLYY